MIHHYQNKRKRRGKKLWWHEYWLRVGVCSVKTSWRLIMADNDVNGPLGCWPIYLSTWIAVTGLSQVVPGLNKRAGRPATNSLRRTPLLPWLRHLISRLPRTSIQHSELRRCVKVEVAVLGSPSLISLMVSVDVIGEPVWPSGKALGW